MILRPAFAADGAAAADDQDDGVCASCNLHSFLDPRAILLWIGEHDLVFIPVAALGHAHAFSGHDAYALTHLCFDAVEHADGMRRDVGVAAEIDACCIWADYSKRLDA